MNCVPVRVLCAPPAGVVVMTNSAAFSFRRSLERDFYRFVERMQTRCRNPASLARQVHAKLASEQFANFMLVAVSTTVNSCCPERDIPAVGENQILFDILVDMCGGCYHLSTLCDVYNFRPHNVVEYFKPTRQE